LPVALQEEKDFPEYIFISRKDSRLRNVTNEDELFALLQKYGFKSYELSKLSFPDKIRLFNKAKVVVSSSGAGLTSLFFCRSNAKVVEFFPRGFVHTHYFNISSHIGLDYNFLICDNDHPAQDMVKGQLEDITVDLKAMNKILNKLFAESPLVQS
jgi:capsular polysaccharide biosynthesis protein